MAKNKFGRAFSDELQKTARASGHFYNKKLNAGDIGNNLFFSDMEEEASSPINPWTKSIMAVIFILAFSLLIGRLFHLQVARGKENLELADSNRIQVKTIHAPRGVIYDRNGRILAQNNPGFRLYNPENKNEKPKYISREEYLKMEATNDPRLKDLEIDSMRSYLQGDKTSHILGYLGEITEEELKTEKYVNYKLGDKIGRGGVEEAYEKTLKGIDGGEIIEVDAAGRPKRTLRKKEAIPGQNLILTVDADLQKVAFEELSKALEKSKACCGAVVVNDPNTGEVFSLVSIPSFDPNNLSEALTAANSPLLNRAIAGEYPPGSTFKIATGLAGLESGKITAETKFEDTGVMNLGPFSFSNWYFTQYGRKEEGLVDLPIALKRSNDIYFYQLGHLVGEKSMGDTAKKLGFGKKIGIDILGESAGLVPDPEWKEKVIGEVWYPGDNLHMAIGQGFLLTTPLQVSNLISYVASDGKQFPPHLGLEIKDAVRGSVKKFKYDPINHPTRPEFMRLIKDGLEQVPKEGGTAWPFFTFPIITAGKTGTAEYGPEDKTHAWYAGYAPVDQPRITATVLMEGGGEGSTNASPVVKEIFRYYFSEDKANLIKDTGTIATESARTLGE
jgi:penicillin-binding protein 2